MKKAKKGGEILVRFVVVRVVVAIIVVDVNVVFSPSLSWRFKS